MKQGNFVKPNNKNIYLTMVTMNSPNHVIISILKLNQFSVNHKLIIS